MGRAWRAASGGTESGESVMMISAGDITDLMVGVYLATLSEAMVFCERLDIEAELMYDVVTNAAGASEVFEKYFGQMREVGWSFQGVKGAEEVRDRLVSAVCYSFWSEIFQTLGWTCADDDDDAD